jgi:hypothetical protein
MKKSSSIMATSASTNDPLTEHDNLTNELAELERRFAEGKLAHDKFEEQAKQLRERIERAQSEAYGLARKDESMAKRLRLRNYNDPEVQQVINHFIRTGGKKLEPEFGADRFPRYPLGKESDVKVERPLLQRMASVGIVTEGLFERILFCPRCLAPSNVYLRFKCTQCGSIDISMERMIEHISCGTIRQESAFHVGTNLICPTCKKLLEKEDGYRIIGVTSTCNSCHASFENPVQSFYCRKCSTDFDLPKAMVVDVFAYGMTKDALKEARRFLGVNTLRRIIGERGYEIRTPGIIAGPSKETVFSMLVIKGSQVIAIDISQSDLEVDIEPVLELYVKMLEATPSVAILGATPHLSLRASEVASQHNIAVAEGETPAEVAKKVLEMIEGF